MTQFDATQGAQASKTVKEQVTRPKRGRVVEVFEHVADDDYSNFEVDVILLDTRDGQERSIPWLAPADGEIKVPKVGEKVIVEYIGTSKKTAIARSAYYTNETRPPKGRAGMWRKRIDSGVSPAGDGDLYVESYTSYDQDPALPEFENEENGPAIPQSSFVRISKKADDSDNPVDGDTLPMMFELFDSPAGYESYITLELNKKNGTDSTESWGLKFDLETGEFKLLDPEGYGIVSDGNGNFTWYYETIDHQQGSTTSL